MIEQIFAVDPGPEKSAFVIYDPCAKCLRDADWIHNKNLRRVICKYKSYSTAFVIEMVACYGMPVGASLFETCVWIGRFLQIAEAPYHLTARITRGKVKDWLCKNRQAKDKNVRRALLDKFPRTGGGSDPEIGTKPKPGPLYLMRGTKGHGMAALAVAVTFAETKMGGEGDVCQSEDAERIV